MLLDRIFGANLREYPAGTDFDREMERLADEIRADGGRPYIIPGGASNPVGALGYVNCASELLTQFKDRQLDVGHIVTATGSAGTQAGMVVGLKAMHSGIPLLGIGVNVGQEEQEEKVYQLARETAEFIGSPGIVTREDVVANCDYVGDGYGVPTEAMNEAVLLLARLEGLLFDPVYSGKALAGLIDLISNGFFDGVENLVFLHTGGAAALFAYVDQLKT